MKPEDIFGKDYMAFGGDDPFNDNYIEGYISRQSTDLYGALLIEKVNHKKCIQLIRCTPKIRYPFSKTDDGKENWNFPKAKRIERYERLDGTNIFGYRYKDINGKEYLTWKTRLLPFVGNSKFGPFRDMIKETFKSKPVIAKLPFLLGMNVSFELWGARDPHLVEYDIPLELSILFARHSDNILPPSEISAPVDFAKLKGVVDSDYVRSYQESQKDMEKSLRDEGDGYYSGEEEEVWYLLTEDNQWQIFKCKPETIELIHWSAGGIGKNIIIATCENTFENWDNPTVDNIVELLLEEFEQREIDKVYYRIGKYLQEVTEKHILIEQVMNDYREVGINILEDKVTVMRALSSKYKKEQMKRVYSIIMARAENIN